MVTPEIFTRGLATCESSDAKSAKTWNTRSLPSASITVRPAPAPKMVTLSRISRSPVAPASSLAPLRLRVKVPGGRMIVSIPGVSLERIIASRSDTLPSVSSTTSDVVVTTPCMPLPWVTTTEPLNPVIFGVFSSVPIRTAVSTSLRPIILVPMVRPLSVRTRSRSLAVTIVSLPSWPLMNSAAAKPLSRLSMRIVSSPMPPLIVRELSGFGKVRLSKPPVPLLSMVMSPLLGSPSSTRRIC